jgi:signal transduction histidine kinase
MVARGRGRVSRLRHPRTTVRWRLTLLYGGLFLFSGAVLLAVTYTLVDNATVGNGPFRNPNIQAIVQRSAAQGRLSPGFKGIPRGDTQTLRGTSLPAKGPSEAPVPPQISKLLRSRSGRVAVSFVGSQQRISDLHQLVIESVIALAIMAVICTALGWVVAGRVLSPLRTMTATTREISEANLNQRLALHGPRDELRELADTIDGLLGRLETAFEAQRRFVANASHELRTPLTAVRALLEMVLSDPRATVATFRASCEQVLEESEQQEQLIDALLALAQGQRGIDHREPIDLAEIVAGVVQTHEHDAAARRLDLAVSLQPAPVSGDRRLIQRLISNLVENALRHNRPGGGVGIQVRGGGAAAVLSIANTGPVVPTEEVQRLLQPFQRMAPDRIGHGEGVGLGLSIVAAIADAHEATLTVTPGETGGLEVEVRFPAIARDGVDTLGRDEADSQSGLGAPAGGGMQPPDRAPGRAAHAALLRTVGDDA